MFIRMTGQCADSIGHTTTRTRFVVCDRERQVVDVSYENDKRIGSNKMGRTRRVQDLEEVGFRRDA